LFLLLPLIVISKFSSSISTTRTRKDPQTVKPEEAQKVVEKFTPFLSDKFITFASYSYCSEDDMKNGKCCSNKLDKDWALVLSDTLKQDKYTYGILLNEKKKRIVVSMTGTKTNSQLLKEGLFSDMVPFGEKKDKMFISHYFNMIFQESKDKIKSKLEELKIKCPDCQIFFTGHSLGAAMATILSLDGIMSGYVTKTKTSPVLITYASPRAGNFLFAKRVTDQVPIHYRIARSGDPVTHVPPCGIVGKCKNSHGDKLTADISEIKEDKTYWHPGGLILYDSDMNNYEICGKDYSENHPEKKCQIDKSMSVEKHTVYLGKSVGNFCAGAARYLMTKKRYQQYKKSLRRKLKK